MRRGRRDLRILQMGKPALIFLILLVTIMILLGSMGNVQATTTRLIKEHHPASTFTDPSGTVDGYLVGQTVSWHIHLNVTTSTAPFRWLSISNLTVTDTLPNLLVRGPLYMSYVSGSQNSSSAAGAATFTDYGNGTLFWNFGTGPFTTGVLAPPPFSNAIDFYLASVTFNATILGTVPDNTYLTNTCAMNYTETFSGVHSAPATSDTIWVPRPPILNIVKVNPAKVESGSNFNYVLQLSNTGYEDAVGVRVEDVMPAGVTHSLPATATSGSFLTDTSTDVVWTGTIHNVTSPANTVNITVPVTANTALTSVFNSASFTAFPSDARFTSQSANCTTGVIHPGISLTKTPSASKVENGSAVTYTYTVTNTGDTSLTVGLVDSVFGTIFSGKVMTPGASNVTTISRVLVANATNTATATGVDQTGATVSANATATVQVIHPGISLTKTPSSSKVDNGTMVTYTYNVMNIGDTPLTVSLIDDTCGTIFSGKVLAAGASNATTISRMLTASTTNVASVTGIDQTGARVSANATATVQVIHPAIGLTKTPSASKVEMGTNVTYTYNVTNTGDTTLSAVNVTDNTFGTIASSQTLTVGQSMLFTKSAVLTANTTNVVSAFGVDQTGATVSATASAFVQVIHPSISLTKTPSSSKVESGSAVNYTYVVTNTGDSSLTVSLTDNVFGAIFTGKVLAAGASNTTVISEVLTANTTNLATAVGVDQTGASVSVNATATVQVIHPGISLTKTSNASKVEAGSIVNYTYVVTNTGDTSLTVSLTDSAFGTVFTGKVLAAGASNTTVVSSVLAGNTTNIATATGVDQTGAAVSANATATVQVIHPGISLTKTPSSSKVESGSSVTYTFTVTNTGDASLTVGLVDSVFGTVFTGKVLAPGASNVTTISRVLVANTTNTATATGVDQTGVRVSANATAFVQVIHPAITLTKTPSSSKVEAGSTVKCGSYYCQPSQPQCKVNYTYVVTNTGDTPLTVSLSDNVFGTIFSGKVLTAGASNTTIICAVITANTTNTATATGVDQTGVLVSANATAFVQVIHPSISLTKTPSSSKVESGSAVNYTYVVTNTGDASLTVSLTDSVFGTIFTGKVLAAGASNTTVVRELITANTTCYGCGYGSDGCGYHCECDSNCSGVYNVATAVGVDQTGVRVSATDSAFVQVIHPALRLTKTPSLVTSKGCGCDCDGVVAPATIMYTYTVTNTGDTTLSGVTVFDQTFNVQIKIGKTTLVPGQSTAGTYNKTYTLPGTYFNIANATGTDQVGVKVTAFANATVTVTSPVQTTRTWGFWKTHTCFTEYVFDRKLKDFIAIDSGTSHARNITSYAILFGAFEADVAKMSNGVKRTAIDSARISLLRQLLAAILNTGAFNTAVPKDPVTGLSLIQVANIAYSGSNATEINRLAGLLDTFNGSGDNVALPQGLPNPGNATPSSSIAIANIAFWDKL